MCGVEGQLSTTGTASSVSLTWTWAWGFGFMGRECVHRQRICGTQVRGTAAALCDGLGICGGDGDGGIRGEDCAC